MPDGIWKRRLRRVGQKMPSREMPGAPIHSVGVHVHSMEFGFVIPKKPCDGAPASAPKIQHPMRARKIHSHISDALLYQICAARANPNEFTN
jgi:hypothetical protein